MSTTVAFLDRNGETDLSSLPVGTLIITVGPTMITQINAAAFDDDNGKGPYVGINVGVKLDPNEEEHLVSITWNPNTDEVSLERI